MSCIDLKKNLVDKENEDILPNQQAWFFGGWGGVPNTSHPRKSKPKQTAKRCLKRGVFLETITFLLGTAFQPIFRGKNVLHLFVIWGFFGVSFCPMIGIRCPLLIFVLIPTAIDFYCLRIGPVIPSSLTDMDDMAKKQHDMGGWPVRCFSESTHFNIAKNVIVQGL